METVELRAKCGGAFFKCTSYRLTLLCTAYSGFSLSGEGPGVWVQPVRTDAGGGGDAVNVTDDRPRCVLVRTRPHCSDTADMQRRSAPPLQPPEWSPRTPEPPPERERLYSAFNVAIIQDSKSLETPAWNSIYVPLARISGPGSPSLPLPLPPTLNSSSDCAVKRTTLKLEHMSCFTTCLFFKVTKVSNTS